MSLEEGEVGLSGDIRQLTGSVSRTYGWDDCDAKLQGAPFLSYVCEQYLWRGALHTLCSLCHGHGPAAGVWFAYPPKTHKKDSRRPTLLLSSTRVPADSGILWICLVNSA